MKYASVLKCLEIVIFFTVIAFFGCTNATYQSQNIDESIVEFEPVNKVSLIVLGTTQDAGSPQIGCTKACCKNLFLNPDHSRKVAALGVVIPSTKTTLLFDATPDIAAQMHQLNSFAGKSTAENPDAIFLTHAHIGHYTGLMYLGKEATNASEVRVFAMPRLANFLTANGPWSQLVSSKNIALNTLKSDSSLLVTPNIEITPFLVPHRDEFSETVGYVINGPSKSALFIPDIDKWSKWERGIVDEIAKVDYAFIDGTFYDAVEINNRDILEIPHPFIIESMQLFDNMTLEEKRKIHFIHFNHTNPAVLDSSSASQLILSKGYNIARINSVFEL